MSKTKPLFELGQVVSTPNALRVLDEANVAPSELLDRHVTGDFGSICQEDRGINEEALKSGGRIFSVYDVGDEVVWLITESDRSSSCLLLPSEY